MKSLKMTITYSLKFTGFVMMLIITTLGACSKKSSSAKSSASSESATIEAPVPSPPEEVKDGMQIKRNAEGNFIIQLVIVNLEPVKLMKPVKEGYVVWMVNPDNTISHIGTIEGANTWNTKKDVTKFESVSTVKPNKVFITAETDLKTQKPGKQVVWSTGNF